MRPLLAALTALAAALPARAFDSTCREYADRSLEPSAYAGLDAPRCEPFFGPRAARERWVGGLDEHRRLFDVAATAAGLPAAAGRAMRLRVFASAATVHDGEAQVPSVAPVPFAQALRVQARAMSPGELAQLPDFSYALWDWAGGHETCPIPEFGEDPAPCHDFAAHMGPVNANHFLPLARDFHARYHALALARAGECRALRDRLGASAARFRPFLLDCESEALSLEAVAQHYLHDAFSTGHMWERWGGPDIGDFAGKGDEARARAVMVALVSGLVHGARGVLQVLPEWTSFDVNDALGAPSEAVRWVASDGTVAPGLGDDYLDRLQPFSTTGPFPGLSLALWSCAAPSVRAVYEASGLLHGAAGAPGMPGLRSVDPGGDACFRQAATNGAMRAAMAIQFRFLGLQVDLPIDGRVASLLVPKIATSQGAIEVPPALRNEFRLEVARLATMTRLRARLEPDGTQSAGAALGSLMGAPPNRRFVGRTPIASYVDPDLPWPGTTDAATPDAGDRALLLARLFHRAHAADWCARTSEADLAALRARAADTSLDADGRAAACEACREIAGRHLRRGTAAAWDTAADALCPLAAPGAAALYQDAPAGTSGEDLARLWCGCG